MVHIDISLVVGLHGKFVEHALGGTLDAEDENFVDELGGSLGIKILVANRFGDADGLAVVVVTNLSPLVMPVVVVLTIVKVKMS